MRHWTESVFYEDLERDEIELIPARCSIAQLSKIDRYRELGLDPEKILEGLPYTLAEFEAKESWLNPYQVQLFDKNFLKYLPKREPHFGQYIDGAKLPARSSIVESMFIRSLSVRYVCNNIAKESAKYHHEYTNEVHGSKNTSLKVLMRPYPFFKAFAMGHECHFVRGVIDGYISLKRSVSTKVEEICCSTRIESVIENYYYDQNLKFRGKSLYHGDQIIAEYSDVSDPEIPGSAFVGVRVINDFYFENQVVFKKGEIYNAPFCCFVITYD
ncbi:MAG: hypothetical protein OCD02_02890 [Spirochaetaceae bacterium]